MSRHTARARSGSNRSSLYDEITQDHRRARGRPRALRPALRHGSGEGPLAMPKNAATGRFYSGNNVLILWG